ncbi:MFS transporter [SAR202 cluster bacterium AC-409-J13_OGT_754m]|nr:MFS transporter [SAR202 cluster bacterium AC-409-J13_OGT_754m]
MSLSWAKNRINKVFFGWWIVLAGIGNIAITGGLFVNGFQFYFEPIRKQFGWSRTLMSGAYSLARVEGGFLGPIGGYLVENIGPRTVVSIGFSIFALGFLMLSQTASAPMFYVSFLILSIGSGLASWTPVGATINNWFKKKRARALGCMMLGMGIGGVLISPVMALLINNVGWSNTAVWCAVFALVVGLPLSRTFRYNPEPYGYLPDGERQLTNSEDNIVSPEDGSGEKFVNMNEIEDFGVIQALRTPSFWFLSLGHSVSLLAVSSLSLHLVPFLETDMAMSKTGAAQVVMVLTGSMMFAQPVGGFLSDRYKKQYVAAVCMVLHSVALLLLATADNVGQIFFAAALHGMTWGVRGPTLGAMRGDFFGRRHFAVISGFNQLVTMGGQTIGPLLTGFMADRYGYPMGFKVIAIITGLGFLLFLLLKKPINYTNQINQ